MYTGILVPLPTQGRMLRFRSVKAVWGPKSNAFCRSKKTANFTSFALYFSTSCQQEVQYQ